MTVDSVFLERVIDFPPLYTLQPNESSRRKQLSIWRDILIMKGVYEISLTSNVFANTQIKSMIFLINRLHSPSRKTRFDRDCRIVRIYSIVRFR